MSYTNTTNDTIPRVYPLSRPVKGVDDRVDHRVNYIGFRQEWRAYESKSNDQIMHGSQIYLQKCGGRFQDEASNSKL